MLSLWAIAGVLSAMFVGYLRRGQTGEGAMEGAIAIFLCLLIWPVVLPIEVYNYFKRNLS